MESFPKISVKVKSLSRVQLFATPRTVLGIFQARVLKWVAISFSIQRFQYRKLNSMGKYAFLENLFQLKS